MTHIRRLFPDIIRIVLTGDAQLKQVIDALNDELIFRFLVKPTPVTELRQTVAAGRRQSELVRAQKELLEQTWRGTVNALLDVLALFEPAAFGRGDRMARMAERWASDLSLNDPWIVGTTCRLLQIGAAGVPHQLLVRLEAGDMLTQAELNELGNMPGIVERILSSIPRLEPIREILRDLNALATPDNMGATIVRLAIDVDYWMTRGKTLTEALARVQARNGNYPEELLLAARERTHISGRHGVIREIPLANVQVGMTFDAEVRSPHGLLLAARGQEVTPSILERIHRQWHGFASDQKVLVEVE